MSVENLVKIEFESEGVNSKHTDDDDEGEISANNKNCNNRNQSYSDEVMICDNNSQDESLANESQPLLGGGLDHHDAHQVIYNQFPSKCTTIYFFLDL